VTITKTIAFTCLELRTDAVHQNKNAPAVFLSLPRFGAFCAKFTFTLTSQQTTFLSFVLGVVCHSDTCSFPKVFAAVKWRMLNDLKSKTLSPIAAGK
jgi:hypothetical protein